MSDIRQPLYGAEADRVRTALRRASVPHSHIRAEIAGHGQYQCTAVGLDELIEQYWALSRKALIAEVKELQGDPEYSTHGLAKIELIMILAELRGFATN